MGHRARIARWLSLNSVVKFHGTVAGSAAEKAWPPVTLASSASVCMQRPTHHHGLRANEGKRSDADTGQHTNGAFKRSRLLTGLPVQLQLDATGEGDCLGLVAPPQHLGIRACSRVLGGEAERRAQVVGTGLRNPETRVVALSCPAVLQHVPAWHRPNSRPQTAKAKANTGATFWWSRTKRKRDRERSQRFTAANIQRQYNGKGGPPRVAALSPGPPR